MKPDQNPFSPEDTDRHQLWDAHIRNDIEAFLRSDWQAVAGDFDEAAFVALDAGRDPDPVKWQIGFPTLAHYRDVWLRQSEVTRDRADPEKLRDAMYAGVRLARIDFYPGGRALLHKQFDGHLPLKDGTTEPYGWQSLFTLRKGNDGWKIISFVGYLPA